MSLKITSITPHSGIGECDGLPFAAEIRGDRFTARIGQGRQAWTDEAHDAALTAAATEISAIRGLIYRAIARYRDDQKALPAAA